MLSRLRGHLTPEEIDYVVCYLWGGVWAVAYFVFTPDVVTSLVDRLVASAWLGTSLIGAVIAALGIIRLKNLTIEYSGVLLLLAAPIGFALLQLILGIFEVIVVGETQRIGVGVYALWPMFWLIKRLRFLRRKIRAARMVPLDGDSA